MKKKGEVKNSNILKLINNLSWEDIFNLAEAGLLDRELSDEELKQYDLNIHSIGEIKDCVESVSVEELRSTMQQIVNTQLETNKNIDR